MIGPQLLFLLAAVTPPAPPPPLAITHVTVVDATGGPSQPDMTVVVRAGRIASVERSGAGPLPKDLRVVEGRGKFLIPGLWDMHVHVSWTTQSALPVLVANGVTSVRDMGGRLGQIDEWRTQIAAGLLTGPRILRAGPILNGKAFNPLQMVPGTPDESRGVVRTLAQVGGVDFVKVHRRLPRDVYFAVIDEARKQGLTVVGHIPMEVTPAEASDAGQATLEHTETLFEGTFSAPLKDGELPDAIQRFRAEGAQALFARFVANQTAVTPTLIAQRSFIDASDPSTPADARGRYVARSVKEEWKKLARPVAPEALAEMRRTFTELSQVVGQMNRAGVTLLAGSDIAGPRVPGFTLHEELVLLVDAGLTPLQALQAATVTPARVLKRADELGTVANGRLADLVLLDADPLADIKNTQRIAAVVLGGKLLLRPELDGMLAGAERLAESN